MKHSVKFDVPTPRIISGADLTGVPAGGLLDVLISATMIMSLPQAAAGRVDALAIATGQGEQWRLIDGIRRWEAGPRLRHLLVANGNPAERTYTDLTLDDLRDLGLRRTEGVLLQSEPAPNTGLQAAWIARQVRARDIGSLALTVSAYHLPRIYLTVLRELDRNSIRIPLIPVPAAVAPDARVPETGASSYDLVAGETKRILDYRNEDWVASPADLRDYLRWLWSHHELLLTGR